MSGADRPKPKRRPRRVVLTARHWIVIFLLLVASGIAGGLAGLRARVLARGTKASSEVRTSHRAPAKLEVARTIYDKSFGEGWADWGWGPHHYPRGGTVRIDTSNFGGIIFHHDELRERFGGVVFRYRAPEEWGDFLVVSVDLGKQGPVLPDVVVERRHVADVGGGWREVFVPWGELNPQNSPIDRVVIASRLSNAAGSMTLDKIALTKPAPDSPHSTRRDVKLAILCGEPTHAINPWIYGISHGAFESGGTINRIGGNPMSRLNWELGPVWNTGSDWFFENVRGEGDVGKWIDEGISQGVPAAMTVPIIGWVAKDTTSSGFPLAKFGKQSKHDEKRPEAGDGIALDGGLIKPGPPTETSIEAPPELVGRWVKKLREGDAARGKRGVVMYFLDNEPSLWNKTHRDVHPEPVGYDELLDRTLRYGKAVRDADPEALIAGPAEWGWTNYFTSAKDREAKGGLTGPDRRAHGDIPLIPWYLLRLAERERTTGARLLDVLDVHYYPAAPGLYGSDARTDPESAALRLRATRSLWDPTYRDESWIADAIRLIPRLKEWVATHYPGRQISLGEWSFGADDHVSGALATAEALGRFGQQGLDAAFYWGGPKTPSATYWAFRAFRNFDGKGARFLDQSVRTSEAPGVSLFASRDAAGKSLVAVLLNLDPDSEVRVDLNLDSCGSVRTRRTFRYASGAGGLAEEKIDAKLSQATLTPYSLEVLEFTFEQSSR